jgi:hypothetical protein
VAVEFVWRHPDRREVALALYVALRMANVGGWRHLVVCDGARTGCYCGVELAPDASEEAAHTWARLFEPRYRVNLTIADLLQDAGRFEELYIDGGVRVVLNAVEEDQRRRDELRRRARGKG